MHISNNFGVAWTGEEGEQGEAKGGGEGRENDGEREREKENRIGAV